MLLPISFVQLAAATLIFLIVLTFIFKPHGKYPEILRAIIYSSLGALFGTSTQNIPLGE